MGLSWDFAWIPGKTEDVVPIARLHTDYIYTYIYIYIYIYISCGAGLAPNPHHLSLQFPGFCHLPLTLIHFYSGFTPEAETLN